MRRFIFADPSSKVPSPWASEISISNPCSVCRILNCLPSEERSESEVRAESRAAIFLLSSSCLDPCSFPPSDSDFFDIFRPPMSMGEDDPARKTVGLRKYCAIASFWLAEVLEIIHSTRNKANMDVMKSANATFQAPPWGGCP